jgi:hypothetical protein
MELLAGRALRGLKENMELTQGQEQQEQMELLAGRELRDLKENMEPIVVQVLPVLLGLQGLKAWQVLRLIQEPRDRTELSLMLLLYLRLSHRQLAAL